MPLSDFRDFLFPISGIFLSDFRYFYYTLHNLSESSIRPVVLGRKNWLFSDTQDGANASMTVYSMVETAKANGLDPQKYLQFLLDQRPDDKMTDEDLDLLMPWSEAAKAASSKKVE